MITLWKAGKFHFLIVFVLMFQHFKDLHDYLELNNLCKCYISLIFSIQFPECSMLCNLMNLFKIHWSFCTFFPDFYIDPQITERHRNCRHFPEILLKFCNIRLTFSEHLPKNIRFSASALPINPGRFWKIPLSEYARKKEEEMINIKNLKKPFWVFRR